MDKNVKNVLAAVGAVALVKAAPVLAAGAAIGAVASNPEKAKKAVEGFVGRVEDFADRVMTEAEKYAAQMDCDWNPLEEDECECCNGGPCTCRDECQCDEAQAPEEEETPADWEEDVPVEEEPDSAPEPEPDPEETRRAKRDKFIDSLMSLLGENPIM